MIRLERSKDKKWILQKNISSADLVKAFIEGMNAQGNNINAQSLQENLRLKSLYKGRSVAGSLSTMGVRMSQMCFYMFGYKKDSKFIPSPMTQTILSQEVPISESMLINLFSMQYPNPYSETPNDFKIYFGRLIVKLLTEERLDKKLYIDESIWFLPFIKTINQEQYEELVNSILEYRKLSYSEKYVLFKQVPNYEELFANCLHEFNYYFYRIFASFGVINIIEDQNHNSGHLFKFKHGNTNTFRTDAYASRKQFSGYIRLNPVLFDKAVVLTNNYKYYDSPICQEDANYTKSEWIRELYEFEPLKYINLIQNDFKSNADQILDTIKHMVYTSKFGSKDGKDFELALKDSFDLFREVKDCEIISGSGDTDILCKVLNEDDDTPYKVNVDAKSTGKATQSLNAKRLIHHVQINGSKYCIVVSPRFASGVKLDKKKKKIVIIKAEVLANYLIKECLSSCDGFANYTYIDHLIESNYGSDISQLVDNYIVNKYAI